MLKKVFYLYLLLALAHCGGGSSHLPLAGVDLPPDNNTPVGSNPDSAPVQNLTPSPEVHVFEAPLVLVRGTITQQTTQMNTSPGT
jgi:hypothetical protein